MSRTGRRWAAGIDRFEYQATSGIYRPRSSLRGASTVLTLIEDDIGDLPSATRTDRQLHKPSQGLSLEA